MTSPLDPTHAPTPFTAAEIRRACPAGRVIVVRHHHPGGLTHETVTTFRACDVDGAEMTQDEPGPDGTLVTTSTHRVTWLDLQRHASFPEATTTISVETITTPMGSLECLRYDVAGPDTEQRFWFARSLPGMPVRVAMGRGTPVMEMVSSVIDPAAAAGPPS